MERTNKAIELTDKIAPYLMPMPSDNEQLIRTAVEFSLELDTRQINCLTKLKNLATDLEIIASYENSPECLTEATKIRHLVRDYEDGKRYHRAKDFVGDIIHSISWYSFAAAKEMEGKVNKTAIQ